MEASMFLLLRQKTHLLVERAYDYAYEDVHDEDDVSEEQCHEVHDTPSWFIWQHRLQDYCVLTDQYLQQGEHWTLESPVFIHPLPEQDVADEGESWEEEQVDGNPVYHVIEALDQCGKGQIHLHRELEQGQSVGEEGQYAYSQVVVDVADELHRFIDFLNQKILLRELFHHFIAKELGSRELVDNYGVNDDHSDTHGVHWFLFK